MTLEQIASHPSYEGPERRRLLKFVLGEGIILFSLFLPVVVLVQVGKEFLESQNERRIQFIRVHSNRRSGQAQRRNDNEHASSACLF